LSLLLHFDPHAEVPGLDRIPRDEWPPVAVVHLAFQLMVGCGFALAALALWSGWRWWRRCPLGKDRRLLRALIAGAPLGFIAIESGWIVTEVGRQPWVIQHLLRTADSVTPMPGLWIPLWTFSLLYALLAAIVLWALWRHVAATDER
jgi:cytochrome d ubiquinol oxidase subunit I